jgi:flavorubredoxin
MRARSVVEGVRWVGAIDWDRRLFDGLIPLPDGTSYNAYLVRGSEKTALVDTVDPAFSTALLARLESEGIDRLDYVISHHAEQDHSGSIPAVLSRFPEAKVLATAKGVRMLGDLLDLPGDRARAVEDGEKLPLGDLTLEFIHFPWVHWPETMLTWLDERRLLFSCDLFGSHLACGDLFHSEISEVLPAAKRYYAEIMMPFRGTIEKKLDRVRSLDVECIAPSHGPIHGRPGIIIDAYQEWVSSPPRNLVVIPYISMHDSTRRMVEHFVEACAERGVRAEQFNLADPDIGKLAMLLVDAASIVIGTPTVLTGAHPKAAYAALLANLIRPKARFLSIIGSYGWNSRVVDQLGAAIPNLKVEVIPPVLCKGRPGQSDFQALDALADAIAARHEGLEPREVTP